MAGASTATGQDIFAAIKKRVQTQGFGFNDNQILTLTIDIMNVINTDAANATAHAATEISKNPVRPFIRPV